jgi:hypothetical protein
VLQEQTNLEVDQTNEIRAMVDYMKSRISLWQSQGTLLKTYNIQIQDLIAGDDQVPKKAPGATAASLASGSDH